MATAAGDRALYLAFRLADAVAHRIPRPIAQPAARVLGRMLVHAMPGRAAQVERNLRRLRGEQPPAAVRAAVRRTFEGYATYWLELFELPHLDADQLDARFTVEGLEHVEAAIEAGTGAIVALPHLGNWDFAGAWLATHGYPPVAVAEPLEPRRLFDWFVSVRTALGMEIVPLDHAAGRAVLQALRANRVVCLLCDRDLVGDGVEVELFGERTTLPQGPAVLALRTGAPILPVGVYQRPGGAHLGVVGPPIPAIRQGRFRDDVVAVTQALAARLEDLIRAEPEQWFMLQPLWPSDAEGSAGAGVGT